MSGPRPPPRLAHGFDDPCLGNAGEIRLRRRFPSRLDHIEIDCLGQHVGVLHAAGQTRGRDARTIRVHPFMQSIDAESQAVSEKRETTRLVENADSRSQSALSSPKGNSASQAA